MGPVPQKLRVGLADDDVLVCETLARMLRAAGHEIAFIAHNGADLFAEWRVARPDVVLTDILMPDMDGLEIARQIREQEPTPVIVLSSYAQRELIERAQACHVAAYLVKPVTQEQLAATLLVAVRRHEEFRALLKETADLRQALEDRKVIERAKVLLMRHWGLDEAEAFRRLQNLASTRHKKLAEISAIIMTGAEALNG